MKLPRNWDEWSLEDRINWHGKRVEKEHRHYSTLERVGVLNKFSDDVLFERLLTTKEKIKQLEAALALLDNSEFVALKTKLKELSNKYRIARSTLLHKNVEIMKRKVYKMTDKDKAFTLSLKNEMKTLEVAIKELYEQLKTLANSNHLDFCIELPAGIVK
jgi:protein subunit release factor A